MARLFNGPSRYPLQLAIGTGAYGSVYRAIDRVSGTVVALKQVRIRRSDNGCPQNLLREVAALKRLSAIGHENLVRLLDVCYVRETSNLFLVFEHLDVDLATCLHEPTKAPQFQPAQVFRQLLLGLAHLHSHALIHRDIKPANILLSRPHGHVKLADFGLARVYTLACCLTSVVVTLWYRAPEIVLRTDYGTPIDMWSCGCVLAEIFLQNMPLFASESDSDVAQLKAIFSTVGLPVREEWPADAVVPYESFLGWYATSSILQSSQSNNDNANFVNNFEVFNLSKRLSAILPNSVSSPAIDILAKLLSFDPTRRLNIYEALEHPFVAQVSTNHGPSCPHCLAPASLDENRNLPEAENEENKYESAEGDGGDAADLDNSLSRPGKRKVTTDDTAHLNCSNNKKGKQDIC